MIDFCARVLLSAFLALAVAGCQTSTEDSLASEAAHNVNATASRPSHGAAAGQLPKSAKRYFIEFRSRYAFTYGHSYVVFGRLDANGKMVNPQVAGLAPKSSDPNIYMAGHLVPVASSTGWTDGDLEPEYMSAYWRVMLSEAEYKDVVADIRKLQASSPVWHAALYNCNAFVGDIARSMGYKTPFHWLMPQQYITSLRKMNGGPDAIGWTRPSAPHKSAANKTR
jgi:hypothetical protein